MLAAKPKRKKCRNCKNKFVPRNSFAIACSPVCAIAIRNTEAARETKRKAIASQNKADKARVRPLAQVKASVQRVANDYIRARDAHMGCISCGGPVEHAGHYYPAGPNDGLRFDERNIHGQCAVCNTHKSGNQAEYTLGLLNRYGQVYLQELIDLKRGYESGQKKPYTRESLEFIRRDFAAKLKLARGVASNND